MLPAIHSFYRNLADQFGVSIDTSLDQELDPTRRESPGLPDQELDTMEPESFPVLYQDRSPIPESGESVYKKLANILWQTGDMSGINLTELQDIPIASSILGQPGTVFTVQQQIQSLQTLQKTFDANKASLDKRDISADTLINNELNRRLSEEKSEH